MGNVFEEEIVPICIIFSQFIKFESATGRERNDSFISVTYCPSVEERCKKYYLCRLVPDSISFSRHAYTFVDGVLLLLLLVRSHELVFDSGCFLTFQIDNVASRDRLFYPLTHHQRSIHLYTYVHK